MKKYNSNSSKKSNLIPVMKRQKSIDTESIYDQALFLFYEEAHRQKFILPKSFQTDSLENNKIYGKIENFLLKEINKNKISNESELLMKGLIEINKINISVETFDPKIIVKSLLIFTNEFIYEVVYNNTKNNLELNKKILNVSIDFITINSYFTKIFIHINPKIDNKIGVYEILPNSKEINLNFVYGLCANCHNSFSSIKKVLVIPNEYFISEDKIKESTNLKIFNEHFKYFSEIILDEITKEIPLDINEEIVKIIPIIKIETKFIEIKTQIILTVTNKRIIEVCDNNLDKNQITMNKIFQLSKLKSLTINKKENLIEMEYENIKGIICYYSILVNDILNLIKTIHSKECLNELNVIKI